MRALQPAVIRADMHADPDGVFSSLAVEFEVAHSIMITKAKAPGDLMRCYYPF